MTTKTLAERVAERPYWYHRIELPGGVVTPGWAPIDVDVYGIPKDLTGKTVLDVGAWDGFWTFEALRRGASRVVAIDDFSDRLGILGDRSESGWENFNICRDALGYRDRCWQVEGSVYDIPCWWSSGGFDYVFFFGTLYHLRHPLLALDNLSEVCRGEIFVESAILDDFSPYRGGVGHGYDGGQMVMEFYPDDQYSGNSTNWFVPTLLCMSHMVRSAGFSDVKGWKLTTGTPTKLAHCRGFVHGKK